MFQNLLTKEYKKRITQEYLLRLGTVCALLMTVAFFVGIASLVPSYLDLVMNMRANKTILSNGSEDAKDNKELLGEIKETSFLMSVLEKGTEKEKLSDIVRDVLELRPEGVVVVGYRYERTSGKLTVDGIARTRDLVAPYARSLEASDRFTEVPVPIADLAKNTDLEFTLSATLQNKE